MKKYGNLRCTEEAVPRLKALSAKLKYPTMIAFLEAVSKLSIKDFNRLKLDK